MDAGRSTSIGEGRTIALLMMLREGPLIAKDLKAVIPNYQTLKARLERMESDGLVRLSVIQKGHKQVSVELTDLGRDAALVLSMAGAVVSRDRPVPETSLDMRHFDTVVRMLRGKPYVVQGDIRREIGTYDTVVRVLDRMVGESLVVREDSRDGWREIRYSLTPLGRQVSDAFQSVYEKILRHVGEM